MNHHYRHPAAAAPALVLLTLLLTPLFSVAQRSTPSNNNPQGPKTIFNPSMIIIIVILVVAFLFLGFFSVYIRQRQRPAPVSAAAATRDHPKAGLDADIAATLPTLVYSEVKGLKIGKGALECAVCISEFEDDETLRLLPRCSHVFHSDCIDAWLSSHVTCPVCRSNLAEPAPTAAVAAEPAAAEEVAVDVEEERRAELARVMSRLRRFPRSHSTGHSMENRERFTLRLPEDVRREIVDGARMRSLTLEGSSRKGYRGEGTMRGRRSIQLGRPEKWQSILRRSFSAKFPTWTSGRPGSMNKGCGGSGGDAPGGGGESSADSRV